MKAAVVVANEDVQYQEIEEPKVTKGTVKIKVKYSGICGSDIPRVLNHGLQFYRLQTAGKQRRLCGSSRAECSSF